MQFLLKRFLFKLSGLVSIIVRGSNLAGGMSRYLGTFFGEREISIQSFTFERGFMLAQLHLIFYTRNIICKRRPFQGLFTNIRTSHDTT